MSRSFAGYTGAGLLVVAWLTIPGSGQESTKTGARPDVKSSAAKPSGAIRVDKCSIKFIDDVSLSAERTGVLKSINVREGSLVKTGDVLVELRDEVARAAHDRAEREAANNVEVRYAEKAFEFATTEHESALLTNAKVPGTVPDIEVKKLKLAAERAKLQIENAQNQLEINKFKRNETAAVLETYQMRSPFDGLVIKVHKHVGEAVREGELNPIVDVVDISRVYVEANVPVKDIWTIKPGDAVRVHLDVDDADLPQEKEVFEGRVVFVDAKAILGKIRVRAEVANRDEILKSGLTATMFIEPGRRPGTEAAVKSSGNPTK